MQSVSDRKSQEGSSLYLAELLQRHVPDRALRSSEELLETEIKGAQGLLSGTSSP
uniref:Uncharacterized protein n=2 Tax=Nothobranchius TaxID=28779 RepID=A0A1A8LHC7_9TELE